MPRTSSSLFVKFTIPILFLFSGILFSLAVTYWYAQKNDNRRNALLLGETILGNLVQLIQLQGMDSEWLQPYIVGVGAGPGITHICVCDNKGVIQVGSLSSMKGETCGINLVEQRSQGTMSAVTDLSFLGNNILQLTQTIPSVHPNDPPLGTVGIRIDFGGKFLVTLWENQKVLIFLIFSFWHCWTDLVGYDF